MVDDIISQESLFNNNSFDLYSLLQGADPSGTKYFPPIFLNYHKRGQYNPCLEKVLHKFNL